MPVLPSNFYICYNFFKWYLLDTSSTFTSFMTVPRENKGIFLYKSADVSVALTLFKNDSNVLISNKHLIYCGITYFFPSVDL